MKTCKFMELPFGVTKNHHTTIKGNKQWANFKLFRLCRNGVGDDKHTYGLNGHDMFMRICV